MLRFASPALSLTRRPTHSPTLTSAVYWPLMRRSALPPNGRSLALPIGHPSPAGSLRSGPWVGACPHRPSFARSGVAPLSLGGLPRPCVGLAQGRAQPVPPTQEPSPVPSLNRSRGQGQIDLIRRGLCSQVLRALHSLTRSDPQSAVASFSLTPVDN